MHIFIALIIQIRDEPKQKLYLRNVSLRTVVFGDWNLSTVIFYTFLTA